MYVLNMDNELMNINHFSELLFRHELVVVIKLLGLQYS